MAPVNEVVVDLIGNHEKIALHRDTAERLELFLSPDAADGVVGAAKDEHPPRGIDFGPQVIEVHGIAVTVEPERVPHDPFRF